MDRLKTKSKSLPLLIVVLIIFGVLVVISMAIFLIVNEKWAGMTVVQADNNSGRQAIVRINQQEIQVEIASTLDRQYRGLSGRESICADCGLLFNFSDSEVRSFVMRDMEFPLDIIFIEDGVIKNIAAALKPEGSKPTRIYASTGSVDQVLEVNGGYCERYNIKPGDSIRLEQ